MNIKMLREIISPLVGFLNRQNYTAMTGSPSFPAAYVLAKSRSDSEKPGEFKSWLPKEKFGSWLSGN